VRGIGRAGGKERHPWFGPRDDVAQVLFELSAQSAGCALAKANLSATQLAFLPRHPPECQVWDSARLLTLF
jgi:hypothetical protein